MIHKASQVFLLFLLIFEGIVVYGGNLRTFLPYHYDIQLQLTFGFETHANISIPGKVRIYGRKENNCSRIFLHASHVMDIDIESVKVRQLTGGKGINCILEMDDVVHDKVKQTVQITLKENVEAGHLLKIEIGYAIYTKREKCPCSDVGVKPAYFSSKNDSNFAVFGSTLETFGVVHGSTAQYLFPVLNEPGHQATFQLTLIRNSSLVSVSTTPLESSTPHLEHQEWVIDKFARTGMTLPRSILFAVFSSIYEPQEVSIDSKVVRFYHIFPNGDKPNITGMISTTLKLMDFFKSYFNTSGKVTFHNVNFLVVPHHFGAQFGDLGFLPFEADPELKNNHGMDSLAPRIANLWLGYQSFKDMKLHRNLLLYLATIAKHFITGNTTSNAETKPLYTVDDTNFWDHEWVNTKGSAIISIMTTFLTEPTFRQALNDYAVLSRVGRVENTEFFRIMESSAEEDNLVEKEEKGLWFEMLQTLTENPSFPIVTLERVNSSHVSFSQEVHSKGHFRNRQRLKGQLWTFPLKIRSDTDLHFLWMERDNPIQILEQNLTSSSWLIVDHGKIAPFRTLYGSEILEEMKRHCTTLSSSQRLQLIKDYLFFTQNNYRKFPSMLNIFWCMEHEKDEEIWKEFLQAISPFRFISLPEYPEIRVFLSSKIDHLFSTLEDEKEMRNLTKKEKSLKIMLLENGIRLGSPLSVQYCLQRFQELKEIFNGTFGPIFHSAFDREIFAGIVKFGGEDAFNFFYDWFQSAELSSEDYQLQSYILTEVSQPKLIRKLLHDALNRTSTLSLETILAGIINRTKISSGTVLEDEVLSFMENNIQIISVNNLFDYLLSFPFQTQEQIDKVTQFLDKHEQVFEQEKKLLKTLRTRIQEATINNLQWMRTSGKDILEWVRSQTRKINQTL